MTTKQKLFVKEYVKTGNATESAQRVYKVKNRRTANAIGNEKLVKPSIKQALESNVNLFESAIVQTVKDWKDSDNTRRREIAMQNAQYGHDKVVGKATQRIESKSTLVKVSVDLTGLRLGTHYVNAKEIE